MSKHAPNENAIHAPALSASTHAPNENAIHAPAPSASTHAPAPHALPLTHHTMHLHRQRHPCAERKRHTCDRTISVKPCACAACLDTDTTHQAAHQKDGQAACSRRLPALGVCRYSEVSVWKLLRATAFCKLSWSNRCMFLRL